MTTLHKKTATRVICAFGFTAVLSGTVPALADDNGGPSCNSSANGNGTGGRPSCLDWKRLSLTTQQNQQIEVLQQDWNTKYMRLQPQIVTLQRKLRSKFADPNADPLEIMQTQQTLARTQEELRNEATANYLRKRALLTDNQQRQLEMMMHQLVLERQQRLYPASTGEEQNAGLMNIIHKVKWAIEPH